MREVHCPECGAALELDGSLELRRVGHHRRQRELQELNLLSQRAYNRLIAAGLETIGDLADLSEQELLGLSGVGAESVREAAEALAEFGLALRANGESEEAS